MSELRIILCAAFVAMSGCGDDGGPALPPDASDPFPSDAVRVSGEISQDTTWTAANTYALIGNVFVVGNTTLTIEAGTTILGATGSALVITSDANIQAVGTASSPIVFTSYKAAGERSPGDWAGVVLLGKAQLNSGTDSGGVLVQSIEGIDETDVRGVFGGDDDASNCGTLQYVRIEFAGSELTVGNELNGLTMGGCGSGTVIEYVQVHKGKDDGIEFFGGTAGLKHVVISGANDDSLDWDIGYRGNIQFLIINQLAGVGDNGIEADNNGDSLDAEPRSAPTIYNATMVGTPDSRGMRLREGTWGFMRNLVLMNFGVAAVDVNDAETAAGTGDGSLSIESSLFFDIGSDGASYFEAESGDTDDDGNFDEIMYFTDAARNNLFGMDPLLGDPENQTNPDFVPGAGSPLAGAGVAPPAGDAFFDAVDYIGAIAPGGPDWTADWTAYPAN
ncbi:hypothetical protein [Haliangium sp.]|uniref:hypothetical protein n=1 Tax=Haliangium sp. TaxID=2663208 RepID=UPI003D0FE0BF